MYIDTWGIWRALVICLAVIVQTAVCDCATGVHIVLVRGQGPGDDVNVLVSIENQLEQAIPGSTSYALPYDHGSDQKAQAVHDGAIMMQQYITDYVSSCPDAKLVLFGYSMGGIVTLEALCGTSSLLLDSVTAIDTKYSANVLAAITYGEETYFPLMPWNTGNCTVGAGYYPRLLARTTCAPYQDALQNFCDISDFECCGGISGGPNLAHAEYFDKYNSNVVSFVLQRLSDTASK